MGKDGKSDWRSDTVVDMGALEVYPRPESHPYLFVLQGPNAGQRFQLSSGRVALGRSQDADVSLDDPKMSARHCVLRIERTHITVEDLGSKNGTHVNGKRVDKANLTAESMLRTGRTLMQLGYRTSAELELETALIQSERLAAVGTLAAGVAHQFNNINAAVLGYAELALESESLDPKLKDWLKSIHDAASRAVALTTNLLTFSGKQPPKARRRRLNEIVTQTIELVKEEYESEGIVWETKLREVPPNRMDQSQIAQVVLQLLINARHALLDQAEKQITVETGSDPETVWVAVTDSGCGMPEEDLKQVFTPFFSRKGEHSLRNSPQMKVKGPGLGLSASHAMVTQHGGQLTVASEVGKGSTFTVILPKESTSTAELVAVGGRPMHLRGKRVLILDDEPAIRKLFTDTLEDAGCKPLAMDDIQGAMDHIRAKGIDMVLVDLKMPKGSGQSFLEALRRTPQCDDVPAVVITGRTEPIDHAVLTRLGVRRILYKPCDMKVLLNEVATALEPRRLRTL